MINTQEKNFQQIILSSKSDPKAAKIAIKMSLKRNLINKEIPQQIPSSQVKFVNQTPQPSSKQITLTKKNATCAQQLHGPILGKSKIISNPQHSGMMNITNQAVSVEDRPRSVPYLQERKQKESLLESRSFVDKDN